MRHLKSLFIHGGLFLLTFVTSALAGVQWLNQNPLELENFALGLSYALLILTVLVAHEMGHYIAARCHRVEATLPFFLPFPAFLGLFPFGTLGAVIKVKSNISSRKALFDIGVAGPFSGFIASVLILIVGFATLPPIEYLYTIHPEYTQIAAIPLDGITFGKTLFYSTLGELIASPSAFIPPMNEIYHYPYLCVGWFGLLVTALNLLPVGQLDGGHIAYAMFGRRSQTITRMTLGALALLGAAGFLPLFGINVTLGWTGWLFWALVLFLFLRSRSFGHPALEDDQPLPPFRQVLGWIAWLVFVGSFSVAPISIPGVW